MIELCRRAQWAIVRLDHEQHENASRYRSKSSVPTIDEERIKSKRRSAEKLARSTSAEEGEYAAFGEGGSGRSEDTTANYDAKDMWWMDVIEELGTRRSAVEVLGPSQPQRVSKWWRRLLRALRGRLVEITWGVLAAGLTCLVAFYFAGYRLPGSDA